MQANNGMFEEDDKSLSCPVTFNKRCVRKERNRGPKVRGELKE